ncbi:NADP-dependent oxidoreductase [Emcibacter sp. SYSU 3D8]|uniref:NADP-dependent oxidoreductase n=1 Tax=Emcibacter sp. SYSU 3D8 TaxID=3133969 RepID=UPI0031FF1D6F
MKNTRVLVASRPEGMVTGQNFRVEHSEAPVPADREFLIEVAYLIVTPPLRMWLTSGGLSGKPVPLGAPMRCAGLGRVVESRHPDFPVGQLVTGDMGWQRYVVSDGAAKAPVAKVTAREGLPARTLLHVLGSGGRTAYFGLTEYCKPRLGDTMVISGAAGNVGSILVQLARMQGCRVIGIAGSDRKCNWLTKELGCAGAVNYRNDDLPMRLRQLCPDGIDIFFDNVGGETLDAALGLIAPRARVVLCGATSQYNNDAEWYGPHNYFNLVYKQAEMHGFYIANFAARFDEAVNRLAPLVADGRIKYAEDVLDGLEQAPQALIRTLTGENFGVQLVKVSDAADK